MRRLLLGAGLAGLAAVTGTARATLTLTDDGGTPLESQFYSAVQDPTGGGWSITLHALYAPSAETVYEIHGSGGEVIDQLVIDVPCWEGPDGECVPAGSPVIVRIVSDAPLGVHSVHSIVQTGTAETVLADVSVTQDVGNVTVEAVGSIVAGRDVLGPIVATTEGNPARGISRIEAQRDILGDVLAQNGRIGLVLAYRDAGTADQPIRIEARDELLHIVAVQSCFAHINARVNGGTGSIYRIRTDHFRGSIETWGLKVNPFNGKQPRIWALQTYEGVITIGGSFDDLEHFIEVPAAGLRGQVIVNADALPGATWAAPVRIGPDDLPSQIVLSGPGYTAAAENLGGGSVGLVPFRLHHESSSPSSEASIALDPGETSVPLRHYGPVRLAGTVPLQMTRRPAGSALPFEPVPGARFTVEPDPVDANSLLVRDAPGQIAFESGYEYRLTATDQLVCAVPAQPPVAWDDPYSVVFTAESCPGDLDGSGQVELADLLALLRVWGPAGTAEPADLNADGVVNILDLLDLLASWGPCG